MNKKKLTLLQKVQGVTKFMMNFHYGDYALWLCKKYPLDVNKFLKHYKEWMEEELQRIENSEQKKTKITRKKKNH